MSADTLCIPCSPPTFTVATANAPVPCVAGDIHDAIIGGRCRQGHNVGNRSGGGRREGVVFSPVLMGAGSVFVQSKLNCEIGGGQGLGRDEGNDKTPKTTARNARPVCRECR